MEATARRSRIVTLFFALIFSLAALTSFPTLSKAQEIAPCSLIDTVLDCYSSFSTANYPQHNVARYNKTYKNLTYRKGYSLKSTSCLWTSVGVGPNGYPGYISRMQCNYKTW